MRPSICMGSLLLSMFFMVQHGTCAIAADTNYSNGLWELGFKRYHAAEGYLAKAVAENPNDAAAHYYLGKCLRQLKEYDSAKDELTTSFRINPFSPEGQKARVEVLEVSEEAGQNEHPADSVESYARAVHDINSQSADVKGRWLTQGNQIGARREFEAAARAQNIIQEAHQNARFYHSRRYGNYRGGSSSILSDAQLSAHYALTDGRVQANAARIEGNHAAAETQISANSLKQLLSEPPKEGSPHLRALGTNLYVRNYSSFDEPPPEDPVIQLKAVQKRLSDLPPVPGQFSPSLKHATEQPVIAGAPQAVPQTAQASSEAIPTNNGR